MSKIEHIPYRSITIESIDRAIRDWFDRSADVHVEHSNGGRKKVPVVFSSGERFVTSRERKGIRDKNGVLILPLISIARTNVAPDPSMQALGTETATLQIARKISGKTNTLQNLELLRDQVFKSQPPSIYEVTTIPFPDRSIMSYDLVVQAQFQTQMNAILEKIFHELDLQKSFFAPLENDARHPQLGVENDKRQLAQVAYVVGFLDQDYRSEGNFEEFTDVERIIRYRTSIKVPATLQLDPEGEKPSVQVEKTSFGLRFGQESVRFLDTREEIDKIFGPVR